MTPIKASQEVERRYYWWSDILIITLVALALYVVFMGAYPLINPDEGRYSDVIREMLRTGNYITPFYNGIPFLDKPPLYYWIQTVFARLFGLNEWGLRLWPATIATLGCIATYITGRQLFNRRTGLLSAIVLGTSILYFVMAHFANLDLTVALFITFSLFSFLLAVESKKHQRWLFYAAYIFAALAILTKGLIGIAIPAMIIGLWILVLNRWRLLLEMHLITGLLIITVICFPWLYAVQQQNPDFLHYFFYVQQFYRYTTHVFNSRHGVWFYPFLLLVGTLPWTGFVVTAIIKQLRNWQQQPKLLFLLLWIICVIVFFSIPISKPIGYILPVLPALAVITGSYLAEKFDIKKQRRRVALLLMSCLCLYPLMMFGVVRDGTHLGIITSKLLAISLKARLKPTDDVVFYDDYYQGLAFYLNHNVLLAGNFKHQRLKDNWRQDFAEGLKNPKYKNRALNPEQFKTLWHSKKTVYVFTITKKIAVLKKMMGRRYHLIGHDQCLWLFGNRQV